MKVDNPSAKDSVIRRLRRIEGQARGVQRMVEEERDCLEIAQQLASIHSAVQSATVEYLRQAIHGCMLERPLDTPAEREQAVRDLMILLEKVT